MWTLCAVQQWDYSRSSRWSLNVSSGRAWLLADKPTAWTQLTRTTADAGNALRCSASTSATSVKSLQSHVEVRVSCLVICWGARKTLSLSERTLARFNICFAVPFYHSWHSSFPVSFNFTSCVTKLQSNRLYQCRVLLDNTLLLSLTDFKINS